MSQPITSAFALLLLLIGCSKVAAQDAANQLHAARSRRAVVYARAVPWTNGVVPFRIDKSVFNSYEIDSIKDSMRAWNQETCVRFRERRPSDRNGILVTGGNTCWSIMGLARTKYEQKVKLAKGGCRYYGLYLHEFGHALGLYHEQSRPDRTKFVNVNYRFMPRSWVGRFKLVPASTLNSFGTPYDFQSVMQYGPQANRYLEAKNPAFNHLIRETWANRLSFLDVKVINLFYRCSARCRGKMPDCPKTGFVDKNCQCQTPQIFYKRRCINKKSDVYCERMANKGLCENPSYINRLIVDCRKSCNLCYMPDKWHIKRMPRCINRLGDETCASYRRLNQCSEKPQQMFNKCTKACGVCDPNEKVRTDGCRDTFNSVTCKLWTHKGKCEKDVKWMGEACARSCGRCGPGKFKLKKNLAAASSGKCRDRRPTRKCQAWAKRRQCRVNSTWMKTFCTKSCGACPPLVVCKDRADPRKCARWAANKECSKNQVWMRTNCARSCKQCAGKGDAKSSAASCTNKHNSKLCSNWAKQGECNNNRVWMSLNCAQSCKTCHKVKSAAAVKYACKDRAASNKCAGWAATGECSKNPKWMTVYCRKSCKVC